MNASYWLLQYTLRRVGFLACITLLFIIAVPTVLAQAPANNSTLPVAITVPVAGSSGGGGELVVYDEDRGQYSISRESNEVNVVGVTAVNPPLVFSSETSGVPIQTSGTGYVRVNSSAGPIMRGDLLVSSEQAGVAMKALPDHEEVFAMALEDMTNTGNGAVLVLAAIDPQGMKTVLQERKREAEAAEAEGLLSGVLGGGGEGSGGEERGFLRTIIEEYVRAVVAMIIVLGTLGFLVYTFQKTISNATLSVGRNPRARNAIMMVSVGNLIFTLIVSVLALMVAIGVLVLPV